MRMMAINWVRYCSDFISPVSDVLGHLVIIVLLCTLITLSLF